jgi:hypothetical protein
VNLAALMVVLVACGCAPSNQDEVIVFEGETTDSPKTESTATGPSDFTLHSWFPLVDGRVQEYQGTFDGETDQPILVMRRVDLSDGHVFVVHEKAEADEEVMVVGHQMLPFGSLYTDSSGIWAGPDYWMDEAQDLQLNDLKLIVKDPPVPGDVIRFMEEEKMVTITVEPHEDVVVPAGQFESCIKIKIQTRWPDSDYTEFAWFADDAGMVKWIRGTGRVDELVSYQEALID